MDNLSDQSITTLIGQKKAFVTNKGEVDTGHIKEVTIDEAGILKVVIRGAKKATVSMEQVYETVEAAIHAAIEVMDIRIRDLENDRAAMKGRLENTLKEKI